MLEKVLYSEFGDAGFIGNLREGYFDKALAEQSVETLKKFLEGTRKTDIPPEDIRAYGYMLSDLEGICESPHWSDEDRQGIRKVIDEIIGLISDIGESEPEDAPKNLLFENVALDNFEDKLNSGVFDKELFENTLVDVKKVLNEIRKAKNVNNSDVASLFNVMYELRSFFDEEACVEALEAEKAMMNIICSLYD